MIDRVYLSDGGNMNIRLVSLLILIITILSCTSTVFASQIKPPQDFDVEIKDTVVYEKIEAETKKDTSDKFVLLVDVIKPDGEFIPSTVRFNIFTQEGEWLYNCHKDINEPGRYEFVFPIGTYEIGKKFKIVTTTGVNYITYYDDNFKLYDEFTVETYAYNNADGERIICDNAHITARPFSDRDSWEEKAEKYIAQMGITSETPYLIWVSKANYKVSVFLKENERWDCIKTISCSIGAPKTPTVTGEFEYHQWQSRWQYDGYYVGPIMRFYQGYAIHTTLINNDGSDYDGRVGKMISHGCVRVRPDDMEWLTYYVPLNTKIYVTDN